MSVSYFVILLCLCCSSIASSSLTHTSEIAVQIDVGQFFEREWGSGIWLFIYLMSGIGSSIFSVCMMPNNVSVGSSGAVMGLFGGKLGEIFCRGCESKKTTQGRIGHEVRREQLGAVLCSVSVVMAFSFVPCKLL